MANLKKKKMQIYYLLEDKQTTVLTLSPNSVLQDNKALVHCEVKLLSRVRLFATPWTAAYQVPPSMGFSRQEYWSGVPLPSPIVLNTLWKLNKYYKQYFRTHLTKYQVSLKMNKDKGGRRRPRILLPYEHKP